VRDTSLDVDDPEVSMIDANWHKSFILSHVGQMGAKPMMSRVGDNLVFKQGVFGQWALRKLIKPTMKGFWVPVKVDHGATLNLKFTELIGLQNCSTHVGGKIAIVSSSLRSFELIPIDIIYELDISGCGNLLDLEGLPGIRSILALNYQQLKLNLKHVFMACDANCKVKLPSQSDKKLENIINAGLMRKASQSMNERQALLQLQTDLIDHDLEEYSDI
jgi:hypothetical protein